MLLLLFLQKSPQIRLVRRMTSFVSPAHGGSRREAGPRGPSAFSRDLSSWTAAPAPAANANGLHLALNFA